MMWVHQKTAVRYAVNSKMFSIFRDLNSGPDFSVYLEEVIILISFFCVLRTPCFILVSTLFENLSVTVFQSSLLLFSTFDTMLARYVCLTLSCPLKVPQMSRKMDREWSSSAKDPVKSGGMEGILGIDGEWCWELEQRVKQWNELKWQITVLFL